MTNKHLPAGFPLAPLSAWDDEAKELQDLMAHRVAMMAGGLIRCTPDSQWLFWNGNNWEHDPGRVAVQACLDEVKVHTFQEVIGQHRGDRRLQAALTETNKNSGAQGVFGILSRYGEIQTPLTSFDAGPDLLNTPTGVYELEDGEMTWHDQNQLLTKITGARYEPGSYEGSLFQKTLRDCLPDEDKREYFQRAMGSALSGRIRDHKLFILTGRGRNGKSLIMEAITATLGAYAGNIENSLLVQGINAGQPSAQEYANLADLKGLRLAVAHELPHGVQLDQALVKRLTGGDRIKAKYMHKNFFEFTPSHTITLLTNDLPVIDVNDPTIWTRLSIIEFTESFEGREDMDLPMKLSTDKERQAVLDWLIQGWHSYQQHRLKEPESVKKARTEYQLDSDQLQRFLDEKTERAKGCSITSKTFAEALNAHALPGDKHMGYREIKYQMEKKGYKQGRSSGNIYWEDIRLKTRMTDQSAG